MQDWLVIPVTFPPGLAGLAIRPKPIGSNKVGATIGMTAVTRFMAIAA